MDKHRVKAFTEQVFRDMSGAMSAGLAYVGVRTGLFRAMADKGPLSLSQVVEASGLEPRYVEEWLHGMTCAGYLEYESDRQTYRLPDEHAHLLASDGTDHFAGGLYHMVPALLGVAPQVAECFETGGGVPFEAYGEEGIRALDLINRGNYENRLVDYWLTKLPDVVRKLETGARVLDVGCGVGRVSLSLARAFPRSEYLGVDLHLDSIREAQRTVEQEDLAKHVSFMAAGVEELDSEKSFDFITACDCVHDFARPLDTLREIRRRLTTDGTLFVVEPKVADRLEDNLNPVATMFYGFSVFHCMTQSLAAGGPGLGTCLGPARTERLMREAGFGRFELLDIKSAVNLFYAVGV